MNTRIHYYSIRIRSARRPPRSVRIPTGWSDLPPDLVTSIADRLINDPSDVQHFRAVCTSWKNSVKVPCIGLVPLCQAIHSHIAVHHHDDRDFINKMVPVPTAVYLLRPRDSDGNDGWLVGVEQCKPGKLRLVHPLTMLPYEAIPKDFPRTISNVDAVEITRWFDLRYVNDIQHASLAELMPAYGREIKALLWPDPRLKSPGVEDCKVMKLLWQDLTYELAHEVGGDIVHQSLKGIKIEDIILWNRVIWAVDYEGRLYELDFASMGVNHATATADFAESKKRLLQYDGELYMVDKYDDGTMWPGDLFKVYKLHEEKLTWEYVDSFEDKVLFLTASNCFFVPATNLLESYRNCSVLPVLNSNMEIGFEIAISRYGECPNLTMIETPTDMNNVFWPPPKWITKLKSSKPLKSSHHWF